VPFDRIVPPEERRDKTVLREEFRSELSGILNWALAGYAEYRQLKGLCPPEAVEALTLDYLTANDSLGRFVSEYCDMDSTGNVLGLDFYKYYSEYRKRSGEKPVNSKDVYSALRQTGGLDVKSGHGNKQHIYGLTLTLDARAELNPDGREQQGLAD